MGSKERFEAVASYMQTSTSKHQRKGWKRCVHDVTFDVLDFRGLATWGGCCVLIDNWEAIWGIVKSYQILILIDADGLERQEVVSIKAIDTERIQGKVHQMQL